ncbi:exonuclease domain-containing protein [Peptostreptococcus canis]|uniref:BRCT domain-containing protein n=1 Tax=Peptostreptococcus canis TaxID=1159213 RepID=A0ABR6TK01_9FIRM|nr:exonuclease domain-containing protein [Peptostreptococcus canis]MBC2575745.1 hypothetical protein [Peptostreptococcus canis]MBP1998140.1 DNA polymerase III alpha subunit (gram-positive type) [Peptostreptococcus canis]
MSYIIENSVFSKSIPDEYVVIDLEATGCSEYNYIIELSAIKIKNGDIVSEFNELVKPPEYRLVDYSQSKVLSYEIEKNLKIYYIDEFIEKLTGISNSMIHQAKEEKKVITDFANFIDDSVIVGHGVPNDFMLINNAFNRILKRNFEADFIDTFELGIYLYETEYSLINLCKKFDIENKSTHRARSDAYRTYLCFEKMKSYILKGNSNKNIKKYSDWIENNIKQQEISNRKKIIKQFNKSNWKDIKGYLLNIGNLEEIFEDKSIYLSEYLSNTDISDINSIFSECDIKYDKKIYSNTDYIIIKEDVDIIDINSDGKCKEEIEMLLSIASKQLIRVLSLSELKDIYDNGFNPNFFYDDSKDKFIKYTNKNFYIHSGAIEENYKLIKSFILNKGANILNKMDDDLDYIIISEDEDEKYFFESVEGKLFLLLYLNGRGPQIINESWMLKLINFIDNSKKNKKSKKKNNKNNK